MPILLCSAQFSQYAHQALTTLDLWADIETRVVPTRDVRAALRYAELGEVGAAIVYASDARASARVAVVAEIPADAHDPIRYQAILCRPSEAGRQFMQRLTGAAGRTVAGDHGFVPLTR